MATELLNKSTNKEHSQFCINKIKELKKHIGQLKETYGLTLREIQALQKIQ